jgi:hypothetical protein
MSRGTSKPPKRKIDQLKTSESHLPTGSTFPTFPQSVTALVKLLVSTSFAAFPQPATFAESL